MILKLGGFFLLLSGKDISQEKKILWLCMFYLHSQKGKQSIEEHECKHAAKQSLRMGDPLCAVMR